MLFEHEHIGFGAQDSVEKDYEFIFAFSHGGYVFLTVLSFI